MISEKYDFDEFVRTVKDRPYEEILVTSRGESRETAKRITGHARGAPAARKAGADTYKELLGGLIFLLQNGRKPAGISPWDFMRMRAVIESLVKRGQLKPEALGVFDE